MAREYARQPCQLGLLARRADALADLAGELSERGARVFVYPADVTDAEAVRRAVEDFTARCNGADCVIANAGIGIANSIGGGDAESIARLFAVNVTGVTNTLVPFVPILLRQGTGTLVAVSSVAGHRALPGSAAYCASKAALITFMDALRMQLAGTGVHAMTLCPGFVRTPLTDRLPHALPFLLEADDAAKRMRRAIERRKKTYTLPWQMRALRPLLVHVPEWLLRRVVPDV